MSNKTNSPFLEKDIKNILKRQGFTNNEISIYEYLLQNGRSKSGPIIKSTKIVSSAFYEAISSLTDKGFISYEVINNIKFYNPETPERQIHQMKHDIENLESISSLLGSITSAQRDRNMINVYEGAYGFKRAFEEFAKKIKPKEQIKIIGYNMEYKDQYDFRKFFINLDTDIQKQKGVVKLLIQQELVNLFKKERSGIDIYKIKTLPSKYFGPWAIDTTPHEVLISIISNNPIAISIKHPIIVDSFNKNFDFLWKSAK
jgi:sugar-specific transcriptional regulator TrmB